MLGRAGKGGGGHFGIPHPQNIFTTERTRGIGDSGGGGGGGGGGSGQGG